MAFFPCNNGQYEERFNFSSFANYASYIELLPPNDGKQYTAIEYACITDEQISGWINYTDGGRMSLRMYTTDSTTVETGHVIQNLTLYTSTLGGYGTISKFLFK